MKKIATAALAAIIIGSMSVPAMACGGMSVKKVKSMVHSLVHGDDEVDEKQTHDGAHSTKFMVSHDAAAQTAENFVTSNLHGAKIGETALAQFMQMPVYAAPVTLPDGSVATLYVDPETGGVIGLTMDGAMGMLHSSMGEDEHAMGCAGHHGSGSSGEQSGEQAPSDSGGDSQHQH